jgi:hypothetical protein
VRARDCVPATAAAIAARATCNGEPTNAGRIDGTVTFGSGNDHFDGSAGWQRGIVDGDSGDETLVGAADANQDHTLLAADFIF